MTELAHIDEPTVKPCCKDEENLVEAQSGRPDLVIRVCSVCGCRHFELTVDPLHLHLIGH